MISHRRSIVTRIVTASKVALLAILVLLCCYLAWAFWAMESMPVSASAVHPGMTRDEVVQAIGRPTTVNVGGGEEEWMYASKWKWIQVYLYFKDGKVVEVVVDR